MATSYFLLSTFYWFSVRQKYNFPFLPFRFPFSVLRSLLVLIYLLETEIDIVEREEAGYAVADGELCRNIEPARFPVTIQARIKRTIRHIEEFLICQICAVLRGGRVKSGCYRYDKHGRRHCTMSAMPLTVNMPTKRRHITISPTLTYCMST